MFERFGLPRMMGRVLGVLLVSNPPELSAGELAELLRASRGSISQTTRSLVQMGLVERLTKPGERRDYFRVKPGAWDDLMRSQLESVTTVRQMAERGLEIVPPDAQSARQNLEEMRDFYGFWEGQMHHLLKLWKQERGGSEQ
jgi:DNA-binding transcriptional regulator GbsR (MarR family)